MLITVLVSIIAITIIADMRGKAKTSVASVDGAACLTDDDCPCFGEYNVTQFSNSITLANATAYGLGTATCDKASGATETTMGTCDMTWCIDVEPVGTWIKENPWEYIKNNSLLLFALIAILIVWAIWPKV